MSDTLVCLSAFALLLTFALLYLAIYRTTKIDAPSKLQTARELIRLFRQADTALEKMFIAFVISPKLLRPGLALVLLGFLGASVAVVFGAVCNCCGISLGEVRRLLGEFYEFVEKMRGKTQPI